jgi:hypothetical protein
MKKAIVQHQNKEEVYRQTVNLFFFDKIITIRLQQYHRMMVVMIEVVHKTLMVVWGGIEPPTHGFSVHCSTN